jgi:uncharacterized protein YdhG (YjbR/CyaY superfamily)
LTAKPTGPAEVDAYLATFPPEIRHRLEALRAALRQAAPEAVETLAYGIPTLKGRRNRVHYAGYARHIGFYPGPEGMARFQAELAGFKQAKGSVQFPHDRELPLELAARITRWRAEQDRVC